MRETAKRPGWETGDWTGVRRITIDPCDPAWPEQYEAARRELVGALAGLDAVVEHVGSTAVPGLGARGSLDILIGLGDAAATEPCLDRLQALGYDFHFARPEWAHLSGRGHKLHVTPRGSAFWQTTLRFRDALRADAATRAAYEQLKHDLARTHGSNGMAYSEGKTAFVRGVLERASDPRADER
jgi:GrpB-like predicted nucleotidyltransferase (UPF0157 family)